LQVWRKKFFPFRDILTQVKARDLGHFAPQLSEKNIFLQFFYSESLPYALQQKIMSSFSRTYHLVGRMNYLRAKKDQNSCINCSKNQRKKTFGINFAIF